jgi:hypothetical protein
MPGRHASPHGSRHVADYAVSDPDPEGREARIKALCERVAKDLGERTVGHAKRPVRNVATGRVYNDPGQAAAGTGVSVNSIYVSIRERRAVGGVRWGWA